MTTILNNLSLFLVLPALGILALLFIPSDKGVLIRRVACAVTFLLTFLSIWFFCIYNLSAGGYQYEFRLMWVESLGISLHLGIDGINSLLVLLLGIASFAAVLVSKSIQTRVKEYYILFLLVIAGTYGAYLSVDIFFFYFFHEIATIPVFLMMGLWGSEKKDGAAMKLTLYLVGGASIALIGLIALYFATGLQTFDLIAIQDHLINNPIPVGLQYWIFPLIVVGFGITLTMWPFHTWAPAGYAEAPTAISMLHSGVLKKMGAIAIIRFAIQLMPEAAHTWMPIIATLAVVNILFCGLVALTQRDLKYILGYSSVSHMGYILLGLACLNAIGFNGVVFMMFAHGIMSTLAFALAGYVAERTRTRNLEELGGLFKVLPFIGTCFAMAALASAGVPGFANFAAEIMVLLGAWDQYRWHAVLALLGIVITAIYMLKTVRLGFQGPLNPRWTHLTDAKTLTEKFPYIMLLAVLIIVGCWPSLILDHIGSSTKPVIENMTRQ